jgi:hypothetical protein
MGASTNSSTSKTWRARIAAQQASGQEIRVWCRENGCHEHSFYWWRARLNLQPDRVKKRRRMRTGGPMPFAEVVVGPVAEPVYLRLGSGRELVLPASMGVEQVARLVGLIEGVLR